MSEILPSFSAPNYIEYLDNKSIGYGSSISHALDINIPRRIFDKDYTLWQETPNEITNRLGWLELPISMEKHVDEIEDFSRKVLERGIETVILLGMGGSSLAPELFSKTFRLNNIEFIVLDTTDPETISNVTESIEPTSTLVIVSTKSGSTVETVSLMNHFYKRFSDAVGEENAGGHFVAITDPGSGLEKRSQELNFRQTFLNDPDVGGRFSALSFFGLVPASLLGIDIRSLLEKAVKTRMISELNDADKNLPLRLGTILGHLHERKINKLTLVMSEEIEYLRYWIEQLIAESTGKCGKGVVPVFEDGFKKDQNPSRDRVYVFISIGEEDDKTRQLEAAAASGYPVISMILEDKYDIASQFFIWEFATSVAGHFIKINPFDQPDVESAKKLTKTFVEKYMKTGRIENVEAGFEYEGYEISSNPEIGSYGKFRSWVEGHLKAGSYLSIQAFLSPNEENDSNLKEFCTNLSKILGIPATYGFGPRYLHSTGQLHKGDSGLGVFIQLTSPGAVDVDIPDDPRSESSALSFEVLIEAQSLGDYLALCEKGRKIVRIKLGEDLKDGISKIENLLQF